ncbi:MAG: hypothetical protein H6959_06970 [Chromatiaceae bacterium]|nr:hypothetical protein [Chromatiaceae bacterium]MCP5422644.1 hypothetical protein [Chromatiaceae bacterium]
MLLRMVLAWALAAAPLFGVPLPASAAGSISADAPPPCHHPHADAAKPASQDQTASHCPRCDRDGAFGCQCCGHGLPPALAVHDADPTLIRHAIAMRRPARVDGTPNARGDRRFRPPIATLA